MNDNFANATPLSGVHVSQIDDNITATKEPLEPNHAGSPGGASIWYSWTAPQTNPVHIDACFSSLDTLLAVYTGNSVSGLTQVVSNDDAGCGGPGGVGSVVDFTAQAGTTYRIAIDAFDGAQGEVRFTLDQHAAYPQCQDQADNDGDALVDANDPGCFSAEDDSEGTPVQVAPKARTVPEIDKNGILKLGKIEFRSGPPLLRVVPDCGKGRYKAEISLSHLNPGGRQAGGKNAQDFRCRKGHLSFTKSSGFIRLRRSWLREAHTGDGVVLLAAIDRKGKEPISESLWIHERGRSRHERNVSPMRAQRGYTGTGTSCQSNDFGGGLITPASSSTFDWGFVRPLEWAYVQAWGQQYTSNGFTRWYPSNMYSYVENTSGISLGGNLSIVGGSLGVGQSYYFQWNGTNGFPVPPYGWGRTYIAIWTARTGWRGDYIQPENFWGATSYGEWCGFSV